MKKIFRDVAKYERAMTLIKKKISITRIINILSLGTLDGNEKQKYVNTIVDALEALPEQYVTERMPLYYLSGVEFIRDFFNERIKYLGPLREEPRSLYPLENNGSSFDLGLKGENTAAVFENFYSPKTVSLRPTVSHDVSHRFLNGGCRQSENVSMRLTKVLKMAICPFRGSPLTTSEVQMWYKNRLKKRNSTIGIDEFGNK